jgi:hypothetical protein
MNEVDNATNLWTRKAKRRNDLLDAVRLVDVRNLAREKARLPIRIWVEVAKQRGVVVDARISSVMKWSRQAIGWRKWARVHDDIWKLNTADAREKV